MFALILQVRLYFGGFLYRGEPLAHPVPDWVLPGPLRGSSGKVIKWVRVRGCADSQLHPIGRNKIGVRIWHRKILRKFRFPSFVKMCIPLPWGSQNQNKTETTLSLPTPCVNTDLFCLDSPRKNLTPKRGTASSNSFISLWKTEVLSCSLLTLHFLVQFYILVVCIASVNIVGGWD